MKLRRLSLLLLLTAIITSPLLALPGDELENAINNQFKDKTLILLHPLGTESLRFSADGKPIKGGSPGPWTIYGAIHVNKVQLKPDQVRLQGQRVFFGFTSSQPESHLFTLIKDRRSPPCKPAVEVEINLDQPLSSIDQFQAALSKVFALNKQDFLNSVPEFWHSYIAEHLDFDPVSGALLYTGGNLNHKSNLVANAKTIAKTASINDENQPDQTVFKVGDGVKAPKVQWAPEPNFSEAARYEKYKGVVVLSIVVDKEGNVTDVNIVRPLGIGLDDEAANGVKSWRFNPAIRNGEPVRVLMNVEVSFNLY
jgi:TonB family protein